MKILLIHGLSRTPLSLLGLEWYLQQTGCPTEQFGYTAFIVARSLGGLLARAALGWRSICPNILSCWVRQTSHPASRPVLGNYHLLDGGRVNTD